MIINIDERKLSEKKREDKDAFDILQETCINCIDEVAKLVPQYTQSVTNLQNEDLDACKKMAESSVTLAKEFVTVTFGPGRFPSALAKNASDAADAWMKMAVINNKVVMAALDAWRQNIRLFSDDLDTFTKLNQNWMKTWYSLYIPPRL